MTTALFSVETPMNAADAAAMQHVAEELAGFEDFTIDTADEFAAVDLLLTEVVTRKDAAIAKRQEVVAPAKGIVKTVEAWFAPTVKALERAEFRLKMAMSNWRLAEAARTHEARELVATTDDGAELVAALATATEAPAEARSTTRFVWRVKRVQADLLPAEWWCPDTAKIDNAAKAAGSSADPPVIPGVTFERQAVIGARR